MKRIEEQIEVMQHFANGGFIERYNIDIDNWEEFLPYSFNWSDYDYASLQNDYSNKCKELNNKMCSNCKYCKEIYSYTYPLCIYNETEPFQIHNKEVLKCDFHKAKGEIYE